MSTERTERIVTGVRITAHINGATVWWTDVPVDHNFTQFDPAIGPRTSTEELKFTAAPIIQPTIVITRDCNRPHCEGDLY